MNGWGGRQSSDPIPSVEGIEASADPLLELPAAVYLLSGTHGAGVYLFTGR